MNTYTLTDTDLTLICDALFILQERAISSAVEADRRGEKSTARTARERGGRCSRLIENLEAAQASK